MSFLRFHSSASSGNLRGASASSDAFRSARASSDTTEDDEGRAATPTKKMDPAATYAVIVALFFAAGVLEIAGGWMWWQALREGKPWWYALIGSAMLCLYGVVPTFQPQTAGTEDFGRVYAAYGCWFIMLSLARRRRPSRANRRGCTRDYRRDCPASTARSGVVRYSHAQAWGWAIDGNRPDAGDGIGAGLAAVGAVVITFYPR